MLDGDLKELLADHFNESHLLTVGIITLIYLFIRPFINWIIKTKSVKLLSYIITSFVILILLLSGIILFDLFKLKILQVVLRSLGVFGAGLVILHIFKYIYRGKKKGV